MFDIEEPSALILNPKPYAQTRQRGDICGMGSDDVALHLLLHNVHPEGNGSRV